MRIAVIGANGQLGSELIPAIAAAGYVPLPFCHHELQVEREGGLAPLLAAAPDAVINTAALHNMAVCEARPWDAWAVNAATAIPRMAREHGWLYAYVSTDYVFDGRQCNYREDDACRPLSVYGRSKLAGELATLTLLPETGVVCRMSTLFGSAGCRAKGGGNLVETIVGMIRAGEQRPFDDDTAFSPTYAADGAVQVLRALDRCRNGAPGVYHCANSGECSHADFAFAVAALMQANWHPIARYGESLPLRPRHASLLNTRLPAAPPWQDGLRRYLAEKGYIDA